MLAQHARLAAQAGLPADRVLVAEDGDVLAFGAATARASRRASRAGRILLDRSGADGARGGGRCGTGAISPPTGSWCRWSCWTSRRAALQAAPEIVTRGFVDSGERAPSCSKRRRGVVAETVDARPRRGAAAIPTLTRERVRVELRRFFKRKRTQRRPMVIPVVMEV